MATGPYPGTFTAQGLWKSKNEYPIWFSESFRISSREHTYTGHMQGGRGYGYIWSCPTLSMKHLTFEITGRKWTGGSVAAISAGSLRESFQ